MNLTSIEQTQTIAIGWAIKNKKDIISAKEFANIWFKETEENYRIKKVLLLHLESFNDKKENLSKYFSTASEQDWQRNSEWTLETVKHLAVINAAALAGSAALLAAKIIEGTQIKIAFVFFLLGLFCAVADFYFCSLGYQKRADKYSKLSDEIKKSNFYNDLDKAFKTISFKKEIYFKISSCLGWSSVISALIGIALITHQLGINT